MSALLFLLRRYLFPERGNLLAFALWISVAGVALGIVQLMVVLAVMSGFQTMLRENYTKVTSEIVVIPRGSKAASPDFRMGLQGIKGIEAVTPFVLGAGMVLKGGVGGVVLEGMDWDSAQKVTPWESVWVKKPLFAEQAKTPHWIWVGSQLAQKLKISQGELIDVMIADGDSKRVIPFLVTAITKFGIYDHDLHQARVDLSTLQSLMKRESRVEPMYKCKVKSGVSIDDTADRLRDTFGTVASVKKWSEINQNVFLAVEHQKQLLFLVLEIIVALAAMNVVNLLMMSSHHRKRDVAILRAMGMKLSRIFLFFVAQGAAVGLAGIVCGVVLGYVACRLIEAFQPALLSEAIYNVSRLPLRVQFVDVALLSGAAFILCIVFSLLPALKAATGRPVEALRYE